MFTEWIYYDATDLIAKSQKVIKPLELSNIIAQLATEYQWTYFFCMISWVANLVPTIDCFLKIVCKGWVGAFKENKAEGLKLFAVISLFMITTTLSGFDVGWYTSNTFPIMATLQKFYATMFALK